MVVLLFYFGEKSYTCGGMRDEKVCETCKWYETYTGACCNGDSDYCADYVSSMNSCENWEVADNEQRN